MGRIAEQETACLERPAVVAMAVAAGGERVTVIRLAGEIDLYLAPELMEQTRMAIDRGAKRLVFDLTDASIIDSTTLGSMVSAQKRLRARGGWVGVVCPDPLMARVFSITGLDRVLPVRETLTSLLGAAQSAE
jgi:anti-sigma B factor antagonist